MCQDAVRRAGRGGTGPERRAVWTALGKCRMPDGRAARRIRCFCRRALAADVIFFGASS